MHKVFRQSHPKHPYIVELATSESRQNLSHIVKAATLWAAFKLQLQVQLMIYRSSLQWAAGQNRTTHCCLLFSLHLQVSQLIQAAIFIFPVLLIAAVCSWAGAGFESKAHWAQGRTTLESFIARFCQPPLYMYIIQLQSITYICMIWSDLIWYEIIWHICNLEKLGCTGIVCPRP